MVNGRVIIVTERRGPSGTSFLRREVDCPTRTNRQLGDAETLAEAKKPPARLPAFTPLVEGSISWHVSAYACTNYRR